MYTCLVTKTAFTSSQSALKTFRTKVILRRWCTVKKETGIENGEDLKMPKALITVATSTQHRTNSLWLSVKAHRDKEYFVIK